MTGDLLVYPVPFAFDVRLTDWIAALHAVRALGATHIIPGHGAPQSDYAYLDLVTRFLTAMRDETRPGRSGWADAEDGDEADRSRAMASGLCPRRPCRRRHVRSLRAGRH